MQSRNRTSARHASKWVIVTEVGTLERHCYTSCVISYICKMYLPATNIDVDIHNAKQTWHMTCNTHDNTLELKQTRRKTHIKHNTHNAQHIWRTSHTATTRPAHNPYNVQHTWFISHMMHKTHDAQNTWCKPNIRHNTHDGNHKICVYERKRQTCLTMSDC